MQPSLRTGDRTGGDSFVLCHPGWAELHLPEFPVLWVPNWTGSQRDSRESWRTEGKQYVRCCLPAGSPHCWVAAAAPAVAPPFPGSPSGFSDYTASCECLAPWLLGDIPTIKVKGSKSFTPSSWGSRLFLVYQGLSFPTTCPTDFTLQHQTQKQQPYRGCLTSKSYCERSNNPS